ncbi:hypothetical protein [Paenibacillus solani]|uniref:Uncharacterized protein n=2 Tax=Paenibacillus solani TaxID=1705565 RepID=A0A0M1P056_9BACL|nr:hypothetical protein [Paenibacillus solani]KOR87782.1 hypothetical protein AM231_00565 [Paenibacillus solani]
MVNCYRKKIFTALSAALVVSMLATGVIVAAQGKTTLEIAKDAGAKKVEVIKGKARPSYG